jgi:hypothetical protein
VPVPYTKEPKEEPAAEECGEEKPADEYMTEAAYNATTGSYSGDYGRCEPTDEVTKGQIEKILHEKTDAIAELFDHRDEIN